MVVYGTSGTQSDRCRIFEDVYPLFILDRDDTSFLLRDVNIGNQDYSVNRCTPLIAKAFYSAAFRMGAPTPGQENDCKGPALIVDNGNLEEVVPAFPNPEQAQPMFDNIDNEDTSMEDSCSPPKNPRKQMEQFSPALMEDLLAKGDADSRSSACSNAPQIPGEGAVASALDIAKSRKRKLMEVDALADYESDAHFLPSWIQMMKLHQNDILPVQTIENSKDIRMWLEYLPNLDDPSQSKLRCRFCHKRFSEGGIGSDPRYKSSFMEPEGTLKSNRKRNHEAIRTYSANLNHQAILRDLKEMSKRSIQTSFLSAQEKANEKENQLYTVTANMMRTVFVETMLNYPISSHNSLVDLMKINGASMGYHHYERTSANRMLRLISNVMHDNFISFLRTNYEGIDNPSLAITLDGSTDRHQNHCLIVYLQAIEENRPVMFFYHLLAIGTDETAEGLLNVLKAAFEEDGITNIIKKNLISYVSDGAAVMMGVHEGLGKKLGRFVDHKLVEVHCLAHRIHLAIRRAFKNIPIMHEFEKAVNGIYTFYYSHGHKRKAHLVNMEDPSRLELSYIYEVRWIASERSAVHQVITNWKLLVTNLESISEDEEDDNGFSEETKNTAIGLLNVLKNRNFVSLLHLMYGILNCIARYSLEMQRRDGLLIDQASNLQTLVDSLTQSKSSNDKLLEELLQQASCDSNEGCTLQEYEEAGRVLLHDIRLLEGSGRTRTARYPKLSDMRSTLIDSLLAEIESYLPKKEMDVYEVLHPGKIPESEALQYHHGISQIAELSNIVGLDISGTVDKWRKLQQKLTEHHKFCAIRTEKTKDFWRYYLNENDF